MIRRLIILLLIVGCGTEPEQQGWKCSVLDTVIGQRLVFDSGLEIGVHIEDTLYLNKDGYFLTNVEYSLIELGYGGIYSDTLPMITSWGFPNIYNELLPPIIYDSTKAYNIWDTESECLESGCSNRDSLIFCAQPSTSNSCTQPISGKCCSIGELPAMEETQDTIQGTFYFALVSTFEEYHTFWLGNNPLDIEVGDIIGSEIFAIDSLQYLTILREVVCN